MVAPAERPSNDDRRARQLWVDVARGIGIVLVVWGHVGRGNLDFAVHHWAAVQDRWIYSFHMPLFFLLAGLFLWPGIARGRVAFLKDRGWAIIWPYFLWSTVTLVIELALWRYVNSPVSATDLLLLPIVPVEQYWFLYALLCCQLICLVAHPSKWLLWLLTGIGLAAVHWFGGGWIGLRALQFLPFVAAGISLAPALARLADMPGAVQGLTSLLGWALLAAALLLIPEQGVPLVSPLLAGFGGALGCIGLAHLLLRQSRPVSAVLESLGRASFAIFVLHTLFSAGSRIMLKLLGVEAGSAPSLLICFAAGLLGPWLIFQFASARGLTRLLGFGGAAPSRPALQPAGAAGRPSIAGSEA